MARGLRNFSLHSEEDTVQGARVPAEVFAAPAMPMAFDAGSAPVDVSSTLDPESVARGYLARALASPSLPSFEAPQLDGVNADFKTLGTETIPFTDARTVKFRQSYHGVPVYGSLVTVELDANNGFLSINSALGEPAGVDPVAKLAPAEAMARVRAAAAYPDDGSPVRGASPGAVPVPRLNYYYDAAKERWRLVYVVEDVMSQAATSDVPHPQLFDYVVDAHDGTLVAELPRFHRAASAESPGEGVDELGQLRRFGWSAADNGAVHMHDPELNVHTYDFAFQDVNAPAIPLPGRYVARPPVWNRAAVSAHANASEVAQFVRNVLARNGLDNRGEAYVSSINCLYGHSPNREWRNAAWIGKQMIYGQRLTPEGELRSYAAARDVVAHELFHGITDRTARLEYSAESGALNESYSDIFGVILSNQGKPVAEWDWRMGEDLDGNGVPIRNMRDPAAHGQPAHYSQFRYRGQAPSRFNDWGGVHVNSGIHNLAAYRIMSATVPAGQPKAGAPLFDGTSAARLFYLALTQHLSRTSTFADSRRALVLSARSLFRRDPLLAARVAAIERAFDEVGVA